ncbi:MAG: hypothetical protein RQ736_03465 [Thiogranum sp.]|nr:hypothetical protein [Thiogranum sp.]
MNDSDTSSHRVILALFDDESKAERTVRDLIDRDFPMDMLSVLGRAQSSGDDPLGLYYASAGERAKGWGKMGAFWGGLWGLFTGAAGLFLIPGVGPIIAAGPVVEAVVGAAAGAGVGGGVMAGAAGLSHLVVVMRRMGIPEEQREEVQQAVENGHYVVMLRTDASEEARWREVLDSDGAERILAFPFRSIIE